MPVYRLPSPHLRIYTYQQWFIPEFFMKINAALAVFRTNKLQNDCHSHVEAVPSAGGDGSPAKNLLDSRLRGNDKWISYHHTRNIFEDITGT
jgi:hypothetical protein